MPEFFLPGYFQSANYPNDYPRAHFNSWNMSAPAGQKIVFVIFDMTMECDCEDCHIAGASQCAHDCDRNVDKCAACSFDFLLVRNLYSWSTTRC